MAGCGGRRQQIADFYRRGLCIDFAIDLTQQAERQPFRTRLMFAQNDARLVISRARDHAGNALVIGLMALTQYAFFAEHHNRARFYNLRHVEIFGAVIALKQADIALNLNITFEHPGETASLAPNPYATLDAQ